MSATNRGTIRNEADFYATPLETVYALLDNWDGIKIDDVILEPSAGNGNIIRALKNRGYTNFIEAVELRDNETDELMKLADEVSICDFLKDYHNTYKYDVIIGNPPYSLAQEFIDKSLELLAPGGRLIFLLRTNFLESKKRFKWWQDKIPSGLYVLSKRPSFTGKGTDATSYSWFIWEKLQTDRQTDRQTDNKSYIGGSTMAKKVYISGPITGTTDYMERFKKAQEYLESKGYIVVNPALFNSNLPDDTTWDEYMEISLILVKICDAIYLLKGWEESKGVELELRTAKHYGMEIIKEL